MHGNASNDEHLSADLLEKLAFMCLGCHLHLYVGTNFWIIISSSPEELTIYSEHRAVCLPSRAISLSLQCPEMGNNVLGFYPTTPSSEGLPRWSFEEASLSDNCLPGVLPPWSHPPPWGHFICSCQLQFFLQAPAHSGWSLTHIYLKVYSEFFL